MPAATAVPASAAASCYRVDLSDYRVYAVDRVDKAFTPVKWLPRHSDARLGDTTAFQNRGLTLSLWNAFRFEVTFHNRYGTEVARCEAESSADRWGALHHSNDWLGPAVWFHPPNPAAIGAGISEVDWTLKLPPLPPGTHNVVEWDTPTRTVAHASARGLA